MLGQDVKGPNGQVVAQITNVVVDLAGQPRAVVLNYGGFLGVGRRRIAVAWRTLRFGPGGVTLALTREQLRSIPEVKEGEAMTMAVPPPDPAAP
nr:PRC-barrel domain-containing protein [Roseomonas acroporae]